MQQASVSASVAAPTIPAPHVHNMTFEAAEPLPPLVPEVPVVKESLRAAKKKEARKLLRLRVICMNPAKKEWEGDTFTVGNTLIGTVNRYVPFGNDNGWHVENIIYKMMKRRECQIYVTGKDGKGNSVRKAKLIKEFAIEILPDLTPEEIRALAQRQAMQAGENV